MIVPAKLILPRLESSFPHNLLDDLGNSGSAMRMLYEYSVPEHELRKCFVKVEKKGVLEWEDTVDCS